MQNSTTQGAEGHSSTSPFQTNLELTLNTMPVSVDISNPAVLALFCAFLGSTVLRAELVRFARSTSALYAPMRAFAKARPFSAVLGGLVHPLLVPALPPVLRSVVLGIHKDQSDMLVKAFLAPEGREAFSADVALLTPELGRVAAGGASGTANDDAACNASSTAMSHSSEPTPAASSR